MNGLGTIYPGLATNTHAKIPGDHNGDGVVDHRDFFCSFKHLLAIILTSAIILMITIKWTEFINSLFTRIFAGEMWNPLVIKFAVAITLTIIGIVIIWLIHWSCDSLNHIEDHMA